MTKNKNEQLTTMTITVKKDLKNVLRIIAKDLKSTPNQLVEVILAQFAGGLIEQARQIQLQQKQQSEATNDKPDTTEA